MGTRSRKSGRRNKPKPVSLQLTELEARAVPAVVSTLLANGTLQVSLTDPNDAADVSASAGGVAVTGGGTTAKFAAGSVLGLSVNGDADVNQTARVTGKLDLPNGLSSVGLEGFSLDAATLTTGPVSVTAAGPIAVTGSGLAGTGAVVFQSVSSTATAKAVPLIGAVAAATAAVTVTDSNLSGTSVTLRAAGTVSATAAADNQEDGNRDLARVQTTADARVTVTGISQITSPGPVTIAAETKTTATASALAKATNGDSTRDAAFALGNVTTYAEATLTGSAAVSAGGAFVLSAKNDLAVTVTADGTAGGSGAAGASVARAALDNQTRALLSGQAKVTAASVDVTATTLAALTTTAKSTTGGATGNDGTTQQALADDGAATNEGGLNLAGAFAANRLTRNDSLAGISSTGGVTAGRIGVASKSTADAAATADGSATGGGAGVGAAVAVGRGLVQNRAFLGAGAVLSAPTVTVEAVNPESSDTKATATSGAGGKNVGFAGSFARTAVDHLAEAFITGGANAVSANGADVTVRAADVTTNAPTAAPLGGGATGDKFGVGASVAMAAGNNTVWAALSDGAGLTGADDLSLQATGTHTTAVTATTGAQGGVAFTPGVATAVGTNATSARVGIGSNLSVTGNVGLSAVHTGTTAATTKADVTGSKVAVGGSFALADGTDTADVSLGRGLAAGGGVTAASALTTDTRATAFAGANGATDDGTKTADDQAAQQKTDPNRPGLETATGKLGVAAALGLNLSNARSTAVVGGVTVSAGGPVDVSSTAGSKAAVKADGLAAVPATSFGTGVGIAVNAVEVTADARLDPSATVSGGSFRLNADTAAGHTFTADAAAGAGAKNFAVAGALAIQKVSNSTTAVLRGGASVNTTGAVTISATDTAVGTTTAGPLDNGPTASKFGLGATVAVGGFTNSARAEVEDGARLTNAGSAAVTATSAFTTNTKAHGGAGTDASGTAFALAPTIAASAPKNSTLARVGVAPAGTTSAVIGDLTVSSNHTATDSAAAAGTTVATKAGFGVSLAMTLGTDDTSARLGTASVGGAATARADAVVTRLTDAKASARGGKQTAEDANNTIGVESKRVNSVNQQSPPDPVAAKAPDANAAGQASQAIVGAGAIAVTAVRTTSLAGVDAGGVVTVGRRLTLRSGQTADSATTADAGTVDPNAASLPQGVGLAAGVAVAVDKASSEASIGSAATVFARGVVIETGAALAAPDNPTSDATTMAVSGAGGSNLGAAGSFAVTAADRSSTAAVRSNAQVDLGAGAAADDLVVAANSNAASLADATAVSPFVTGGSSKVGIGGSLATVVGATTVRATIDSNAFVREGNDVSLTGLTAHAATATADAGASGGTAVSPALALVVAPTDTLAAVGSGPLLSLTGSLTVQDNHTSTAASTAGAQASGTSAAVGTPVAVTVATDTSAANLARNVAAGGGVTLFNQTTAGPSASATATAKGGTDKQDGDGIADRVRTFGQELRATPAGGGSIVTKLRDGRDQLAAASKREAAADGDNIGVAAAVGVVVGQSNASALLSGGTTVTAGGPVVVRTVVDGGPQADAKGIAGGVQTDTAVSAAVAGVVTLNDTRAVVGATGKVTASDITVEATDDRNYSTIARSRAGGTQSGTAGSVAVNVVTGTTKAFAGDASTLAAAGGVMVRANTDVGLKAAAGGGAVGVSERGVGAAVAGNVVVQDTAAFVDVNASAAAGGALTVSAGSEVAELDGPGTLKNAPTAAAVSGSLGKSARAASLAADVVTDTTRATIGAGAKVNPAGATGGPGQAVSVTAASLHNVKAAGGTLTAGVGGTQFGLGAGVDVVVATTEATVGTGVTVNAGGSVTVGSDATDALRTIAAGGGLAAESTINGSAVAAVSTSATRTTAGGTISAGGDVTVTADHALTVDPNSLSVAGAGNTSAGAAALVVVTTDTVEASTAPGSSVFTRGPAGLTVSANQSADVSPIVAGGAGAGRTGVAGAGGVAVVRETTHAHIDGFVTATNATAGVDPSVTVEAKTSTSLLGIAGAAAGGGTTGIGAGADVASLDSETQAWIGGGVSVSADGNVVVNAESKEDLTSVVATAGGGGSIGVVGSAGVLVVDVATRSTLGADPRLQTPVFNPSQIGATGSVIVTADDDLEADLLAGGLVGSGSVAVGGSAAVPVVNQTTEAIIAADAFVSALGQSAAGGVRTGELNVSFYTNPILDTEAKAPQLTFRDSDGDGLNDLSDPALTQERDATPVVGTARGVAVTATSRTDMESIALGLGGSGGLAINIGTPVTVLTPATRAVVRPGASVLAGNTGSPADTGLTVAAGSDVYLLALGAAGAGSGGVAGSAAANYAGVRPTTEARVDGFSQVFARNDVSVTAATRVDALALAAGAAVAGGGGVAGSADVLSVTGKTTAVIGDSASVTAGETVRVLAVDDTEATLVAGAAGVGIGFAGIGASVGVLLVEKDTTAALGANATVVGNATGFSKGGVRGPVHGVEVRAASTEDVTNVAAAGGGGVAGVAGGVTVTVVDSDTAATIGGGAKVNQTGTNVGSAQTVVVEAANALHALTVGGGVAVGVGALGGGVDVGRVRSDTTAAVAADARVRAADAVRVTADATRDVTAVAASGAGGLVGLNASVSVWSLDTAFTGVLTNDSGESGQTVSSKNVLADANGNRVDLFAGSQQESASTRTTNTLRGFEGSTLPPSTTEFTPSQRLGFQLNRAVDRATPATPAGTTVNTRLTGAGTVVGTSATVAPGAVLVAGGDLEVTAETTNIVDQTAGGVTVGGVAAGAAVGVLKVGTPTTARFDGAADAGDEVILRADGIHAADATALGGQVGFVALGAAVVNVDDTTAESATLGGTADVRRAGPVTLEALATERLTGTVKSVGVGVVAAGASFATVIEHGSTKARVEGGAKVGQTPGQTVGGLAVTARPDVAVTTNVTAGRGGIGAALNFNFARSETTPTAEASIGDSTLTTTGDIAVTTDAKTAADANAFGVNVAAGVAFGRSRTSATALPNLDALVEAGATLTAGQDIRVQAIGNTDATAEARSGSGGLLVGSDGATAVARAVPVADATVRNSADDFNPVPTVLAAGRDVYVTVDSSADAAADAGNVAAGLLAGFGTATATAETLNDVSATVTGTALSGGGTVVTAGRDVLIEGKARQTATGNGVATANAAIPSSNATVDADAQYNVSTQVGTNTVVTAGNNLAVRAFVPLADAHAVADARGNGAVAGSKADAQARVGTASADAFATAEVDPFATLTGNVIQVSSVTTLTEARAFADAVDTGLGSDGKLIGPTTAVAGTHVRPTTQARLDGSSNLTAATGLTLAARNDGIVALTDAFADDFGGDGGTASTAVSTHTSKALVTVASGAATASRTFTVTADTDQLTLSANAVRDNDGIFSNGTLPGSETTTRSQTETISFSGFSTILPGPGPELRVDRNGVITTAVGVSAGYDEKGSLVVGPVSVPAAGTPVQFTAGDNTGAFGPDGAITGSGGQFHFVRTPDAVVIDNNSQARLVLDDINLLGTGQPTISLSAEEVPITFRVFHDYRPTAITVTTPGDLHLNGPIVNPLGNTSLTASGGSITRGGAGTIETRSATLAAPNGSVGSTVSPLSVALVRADGQTPSLTATAGDDVRLAVSARQREVLPAGQPLGVTLTLTAGHDLLVQLGDGVVQTGQPDSRPTARVIEPFASPSKTTTVLELFRPPSEEILSPLPLGVFGTGTATTDTTFTLAATAGGDATLERTGSTLARAAGSVTVGGVGSATLDGVTGVSLDVLGGSGVNTFTLVGTGGSFDLNGGAAEDVLALTDVTGTYNANELFALAPAVSTSDAGLTTLNGSLRPAAGGTTFTAAGTASQINVIVNAILSGANPLVKRGAGTVVLTSNGTGFTGTLRPEEGRLVVNGQLPNTPVTLAGGTLAGTGRTGAVSGGDGFVSPGQLATTAGLLRTGGLQLGTASDAVVQLNGLTRGTQYDALDVVGPVALNGATLQATASIVPALGTRFKIIDNDGTDAVQGTFAGLPANGASVTINGAVYTITYAGGDGNDVELIRDSPAAFPNRAVTGTVEGGLVVLTGNITEADPGDTFRLTIDWGDGSTEEHVFPAGTQSVSIAHRYLDNRPDGSPYPIRLEWRDPHGGGNVDTLFAAVTNAPPAVNAGPDLTGRVGRAVRINPVVTDPSPVDAVAVQWVVKDQQGRVVAEGAGSDVAFLPPGPGVYFVTVRATDDDGGVGEDVVVVTVTTGNGDDHKDGSGPAQGPQRATTPPWPHLGDGDEWLPYGVFVDL